MPGTDRRDPYAGSHFRVEIEGVEAALFSECTGLEAEVEVVEYRTGQDFTTRKLPGLTRFADVTLKRGLTCDGALWQWFKTVLDGTMQRRNVAIVLMDAQRRDVCRWLLRDAWPRRWVGPTLDASSGDVAIESIEIAHEGLELES